MFVLYKVPSSRALIFKTSVVEIYLEMATKHEEKTNWKY